MRNKKHLLIILLLNFTIPSFAQTYKGTVKDTKGEAVPFANVVLFSLPDSTFVTGTTTEKNGQFLLESKKKISKGYLEVSFIGYETKKVEAKAELGTIILQDATNELGEVTITKRRPTIKSKSDRMVVTVKGTTLTELRNGTEMLKHTPGISFDGRGNFRVTGSGNTIFYINNTKVNSVLELQNLNPEQVVSVEIIDNPPASYDAEGQAVVLIKTRKSKNSSLQFESGITQSRKTAGWADFEIVHSAKKITSDLFYSYSSGDTWSEEMNKKTLPNFNIITKGISIGNYKNHNIRVKLDYSISPKQAIALQLNGAFSKNNGNRDDERKFNNTKHTDFFTYQNSKGNRKRINAVLNYSYDIDTVGQKLSIISDCVYQDRNSNRFYYNEKINESLSTPFINNVVNKSYPFLFSIKADYQKPIGAFFTLDFGTKYYYIKSNNSSNLLGSFALNQHYINKEQNVSGYANADIKVNDKLSLGTGIRMEKMYRKAVKNTITTTDTKHFGVYPSLNIDYALKENKNIAFSYSKKLSRPTFAMIDPSIYRDSLFIRSGNPNLKSSDIHRLQLSLGVVKNLKLRLAYIYTKNPFFFLMHSDYQKPITSKVEFVNLKNTHRWVGTAIYSKSIGQKTTLSLIGSIFTNDFNYSDIDGIEKKNDKLSFNTDMLLSTKLPFKIAFDGGIKYNSRGAWGSIYSHSTCNLFFTLQRNFFDNKLSCTFSANDILNRMKTEQESILYGNNINLFNGDNRYIEFSVKYKIGKTLFKKRIQSGSSNENSRL